MKEWFESDECTTACGVDRKSIGISYDSLLDPRFMAKLCSCSCNENYPNIVDLYHNLAIGEGVFLSNACEVRRKMSCRAMSQLRNFGAAEGLVFAADGPISETEASFINEIFCNVACAPTSV